MMLRNHGPDLHTSEAERTTLHNMIALETVFAYLDEEFIN